jgi:hypothetical protein
MKNFCGGWYLSTPARLAPWPAMVILAFSIGCVGSARTDRNIPSSSDVASDPCDLVIHNAKIWTGVGGASSRNSAPTIMAILEGRIVGLVDRSSELRRFVGGHTELIDAGGRRVIPGITDSHTHIVGGGRQLARLQLREVSDRAEFVRAVAEVTRRTPKGSWVQGGRWSVESWSKPEQPTKEWLDPVTGETPVFLKRMDGHQALVNSAALRLGGIDGSGPPDPPGGEIERDPKTGEPTGILKESAMELVVSQIPSSGFDERYQDLLRAMEHANSLGITSVHDMSEPEDLPVFRKAHTAGVLTLRITSYLSVSDWPGFMERVKSYPVSDDRLRVAGFKGYIDGSLGSRTAYMCEPYSDAHPEMRYPRGQLTALADPPDHFKEIVARADAEGVQLTGHAIGDLANHLLLNAYEYAAKRNGRRDARHRIEHVQHLQVADIARFGQLGVVASMQPFHKADDGRYAEDRIGAERLKGSYAYRQLLDSGALLCFGSDFPVVNCNPFKGIDAAVNARTLAGNVWLASHSLTLEEALHAYTSSPPKAIHRGDRLGTLEVGKLADLVILEDDIFEQPIDLVGRTKVWRTIVGGRVVYAPGD